MKLDKLFNSTQQNEDVLQLFEEKLGCETVKESESMILFDVDGKPLDSSQSEAEDHDGFWRVSEFESYDSVNCNTAESNTVEVKEYEDLNCYSYEDLGQIMEKMHLFPDESKTELEVPELVICYKENPFLDIKDICVDENMPSCERILFETDVGKGDLRSLLLLEKDTSSELATETTEVSVPTPDDSKFHEDRESESPGSQVGEDDITQTEVQWQEVAEDVSICQNLSDGQELAVEILLQQEPSNEDAETPFKEPGVEAILNRTAQTPADEEMADTSHAEESSSSSLTDLEEKRSASPSEESNHTTLISRSSNGNDQEDSPDNGSRHNQAENQNIPEVSDSRAGSFRYLQSHGETSFSMVDPVSGLITYSGPIAYSGSLSLRSESSTTSTRSFAFPILQSDWHCSPVRMAKADRRRFRKHRGWRQGLLCCRF